MEGELPVSQECIRSANESSGATSPSHSSQSNLLGSGNLVCATNGHSGAAGGPGLVGASATVSSGIANSGCGISGAASFSSGACAGSGPGSGAGVTPSASSAGANASTSGTFLIWIHNVSPQQRYTVVRTSKASNVAQVIEQVLAKGRQTENPANCQLVVETMASSAIQGFTPAGGGSQGGGSSLRPQSRESEVFSAPTSRRPTNETQQPSLTNAVSNLSSSTEKEQPDAARGNEAVYVVHSVLKRDEIVFLVLKNLPPGSRFALRRSPQFMPQSGAATGTGAVAGSGPGVGPGAAAAGAGGAPFAMAEVDTLVMPEIRQQRSMSSPETPNRRPSKLIKQKAKHSDKDQEDACGVQPTFMKSQTSQTSQTSQFSQNSAFNPDPAPAEQQGVFGTTDSARSADETVAINSSRPLSPPSLHYLLQPELPNSSRSCGGRGGGGESSSSGSSSVRDRSHTAAERSPSPKASPHGAQRPHSCSGISPSEMIIASPAADSPPPPASTPSSLAAPSISSYRISRGAAIAGGSGGSSGMGSSAWTQATPASAAGMQRGESKKGKGLGSGLKHLLFKKDQN